MAEPGTLTHVLEVAAQLATSAVAHAAGIHETASAAPAQIPSAAEAPPPPGGH